MNFQNSHNSWQIRTLISPWTQYRRKTQNSGPNRCSLKEYKFLLHTHITQTQNEPKHSYFILTAMLDCCEKKCSHDGTLPAIDLTEGRQDQPLPPPMNERRVSFHRRFVESQKELKIIQEKLFHAESFNASLQIELRSSVSKDKFQEAENTIERLQLELSETKQALKNETDRHKETQQQLLQAEEKIFVLEDEMNDIHDSRLDVIDLTRKLNLLSNQNPGLLSVSPETTRMYEAAKMELQAANNTILTITAKIDRLRTSQIENDEKIANMQLESKESIEHYQGQIQRQAYELTDLRAQQLKLQSKVEQQRSLLWEMEESRHYYRQRWNRLSATMGRPDETDQDAKMNAMTAEQCKSNTTIESLRRKNRFLEQLKTSLSAELCNKSSIICQMSRCSTFVEATECLMEEQERSLNMATELSVAYAECQMKVDKLTETINRLKLEQIQKSDLQVNNSPFRSLVRNKSYQLDQSTTTKLDGIKSISSIFSRSFNASFVGMDTSCDSNYGDSRPLKVDLLSMSIPKIDFTVSCGNVSGIKVTKTASGLKNTPIPTETNRSKEKLNVASSFTDNGDVLSGTSKHDVVRSFRKETGSGTVKKDKEQKTSKAIGNKHHDTSDDFTDLAEPRIITI